MSTQESTIWAETIPTSLVREILTCNEKNGIQTVSRRSYFVYKRSGAEKITALIAYVDDIIVTGDDF